MKEIKDLGIKIGSKEEAFWNEIKQSTSQDIEIVKKLLKVQKAILKMAEKNIKKKRK